VVEEMLAAPVDVVSLLDVTPSAAASPTPDVPSATAATTTRTRPRGATHGPTIETLYPATWLAAGCGLVDTVRELSDVSPSVGTV
jgi:hypothetical protein